MPFHIDIPAVDDAALIADLHRRAMDTNELTHAQFPNTEAWDFFRTWLIGNTQEHIEKPNKGILVARDEETGEVASFVKWLDNPQGEEVNIPVDLSAIEGEFPAFCGRDVIEEYANITAATRKRILGRKSCYHVTFLCTDPKWSGKGAASALMERLGDMAAGQGREIILEAVMPAVPFYKRLDFSIRQQLQMMLPKRNSSQRTEIYQEQVMVWSPPSVDG